MSTIQPEHLVQLKCFPSLYLLVLPFIYLFSYFILFLLSLYLRSFADFIEDNYCTVVHLE